MRVLIDGRVSETSEVLQAGEGVWRSAHGLLDAGGGLARRWGCEGAS
jgi:hypothetical protein